MEAKIDPIRNLIFRRAASALPWLALLSIGISPFSQERFRECPAGSFFTFSGWRGRPRSGLEQSERGRKQYFGRGGEEGGRGEERGLEDLNRARRLLNWELPGFRLSRA
jgi:hypothetical protein